MSRRAKTSLSPLLVQTTTQSTTHFVDNNGVCEIVLTDLPAGVYTVTEDAPVYPFTVSGGGPVTVIAGQQTGVNIVNTGSTTTTAPPVGSLRITKTIAGDRPSDSVWKYEDFSVVVTGPAPDSKVVFNGTFNSSGEIVISGLAPGTYTVTEAAPGYPWTISGNGTVEVVANQEGLKAITNTGSTSTSLSVVTTDPTVTTLRTTDTTLRTTGHHPQDNWHHEQNHWHDGPGIQLHF